MEAILAAPEKQAASIQAAIIRHIQDQQNQLGPGEELLVLCFWGPEVIRVRQVSLPNWHVLILSGEDGDGNPTSFIMNMQTAQLVCKVVKVEPHRKPTRIGFSVPEDPKRIVPPSADSTPPPPQD